MRVNIVVTFPFPYGLASCNRVISYSRELVKLGTEVCVHCLTPYIRPSDKEDSTIPRPLIEGNFEGIAYKYPAKTVDWPEHGTQKIKKGFLRIKSYLYSFFYLFKDRKKVDFVQIYSNSVWATYYYWAVCKIIGVKYIVEKNELSPIEKNKEYYQKTLLRRLYSRIEVLSYKLFDGWLIETQSIADYFIPKAKKNVQYCIVPMTVEHERFSSPQRTNSQYGQYIAYCGNMQEVDGISILIEAFSHVHKKFPEVKLLLAGESSDTPKQKALAQDLGVAKSVVFLGRLNRDEVPQFLKNATILALASPTSLRSCASMPCKVGEYLWTGNPVVVTALGEIPKYLTDGVNSFLSEADSAEKFASKLEHVLRLSEEERMAIGLEGQKTAIKNFNSEQQAINISNFLQSLI